MNDAIISFTFAGLASPYCFTTPERLALDIAAGLEGFLPGNYTAFVRSETEPVVDDRDKIWVQVNADGAPTGKTFGWAYGKWVMLNPRRNPDERVWFVGAEDANGVWAYDGGDGSNPSVTPPTLTTGAMWEVDHDFDFRFPLAAGTSPDATTVAVGDTGGEERVTLLAYQLASHTHDIAFKIPGHKGEDGTRVACDGGTASTMLTNDIVQYPDAELDPTYPLAAIAKAAVVPPGSDTSHNNLPPYRVGYWLKPTARLYYTS